MPKPLLPGQWLRVVGLTLTLLLALLPARAQDIGTTFDVGNLTYRVLTESTVEVAGPAEGTLPTDVTIPAKFNHENTVFDVVAIGENAFWGQEFVTVSLPASVKILKAYSFFNCWQMTSIDMPGVENIESAAIAACWSLRSVALPETLLSLASDAFYDSKNNNDNHISYIYFLGKTAPEITGGNKLSFLQEDIKVYVPTGCESAYQAIIATSADNIKTFPTGDSGALSVSLNQSSPLEIVYDRENRTIDFIAHVESASTYGGSYDWSATGAGLEIYPDIPQKATLHINPGEASITVTVTDPNGKPISATCKVYIYGIDMRMATYLKPGATYKYTNYRIYPESQTENIILNWSTTDNQIATVDQQGNITALSEGKCYLQAQATINGHSTTSQHEILVFSEISSDPESLLLKVGESSELWCKIPFMGNNRYGADSWTSSDENIVLVNGNRAIGISNGTATLTGTMIMSDGETITATCPVVIGNLSQNEIFEVGNIRYKVIGINTIEVAGPVDKTTLINAEIPTEVTYNGMNLKVTSIGQYAFDDCKNLKSITIADGITSIGERAFFNCENLSTVNLATTIKTIDREAFYGCRSLASITFPEGVANIASGAFANTSLTNVTFPESLVKLGETAFRDTKSVYFKGEVPPTIIDWNGNKAQSLILDHNDAIIYVPNEASVTAYEAIAGGHTVKAIVIPDNGATKVSFSENEITLISGSDETQTIGLSIEPKDYDGEIEWNISPEWLADIAVADDKMSATLTPSRWNSGVGAVTATVTSTDGSKLTASCKINVFGLRISSPIVLTPETTWKAECEIDPESMAEGVELQWSINNTGIASVDQNGKITAIADGRCQLKIEALVEGVVRTYKEVNLIVTSALRSKPEMLFLKPGEQSELSILLAEDLWTSRGNWTSTYPEVAIFDNDIWKVRAIKEGSTELTTSYTLSDGTTLPVTCKVIVGNISSNEPLEINGIKYRVLTENTVEVAGPTDGTKPTNVTITDKVNYNDMEFDVVAIGEGAFNECSQLASISIPESVTTIKHGAFQSCSNLTSIEIPSHVSEIAEYTFNNCNSLASVKLPEGLTRIGRGAFMYCFSLASIDIPSTVTTIENDAFWDSNSLSTIVFSASLTSLGNTAIGACGRLNSIYFLGTNPPAVLNYDGEATNGLERINSNAVIYVPTDSYDAYAAKLSDNADQIAKVSIPANGAISVKLNPSSILLSISQEATVPIEATIETATGAEYDGEYTWNVSQNYNATITSVEGNPQKATLHIWPNQSSTVTLTVLTPEGTPISATCQIIPLQIEAPDQVTMLPDENYQIEAKITPENYAELSDHSDLKLRYTTYDSSISVDEETGLVTAINMGSAQVQVNAFDKDGNYVTGRGIDFIVLNSVTPQYTHLTIPIGNGAWNYAVSTSTDRLFNFNDCESDNPRIAAISEEGWISANSVGETDMSLTFTTTTGYTFPTSTCHVKVVDAINEIVISAPDNTATLPVGSTLQLSAKTPDGDDESSVPAVWEIEEYNGVADIDWRSGILRAYRPGTCKIIARTSFNRELTATYEVTVTPTSDADVQSVTIEPSELVLPYGVPSDPITLTANVEPETYSGRYDWNIESKDKPGLEVNGAQAILNITPTSESTVSVTVYDSNGISYTASCKIIPVKMNVPEQVILFAGEMYQLPTITVPDGYTVSYTSDRTYVATVDENGYISAVGVGVAGITVTVKDKNGKEVASATTNVAVGNDVSQLYDNITIPVYRAMMVPLVLEPLDYLIGFMTCEAENPEIVTAYNNGSIYGTRVGETMLNMTFGQNAYTCKVKVVSEIRDIEIHTGNGTNTVVLGEPLKLYATTSDGDPVPVTWEMYSSPVASINYYTGEVTAVQDGSCTIIARAVFDPELVAYYVLNVTSNPVRHLVLDKSVLEMTEGETEQLIATVTPANADAEITWTSSDDTVATVDAATGEVTAVSAGTATITVRDAVTGISTNCTVTVSKPSGIDGIDSAAISVRAESGRIIVTGIPADAAVEVFDIAGSRIALERGDCTVSVNTGIYVVRVAGTTVKVAVK